MISAGDRGFRWACLDLARSLGRSVELRKDRDHGAAFCLYLAFTAWSTTLRQKSQLPKLQCWAISSIPSPSGQVVLASALRARHLLEQVVERTESYLGLRQRPERGCLDGTTTGPKDSTIDSSRQKPFAPASPSTARFTEFKRLPIEQPARSVLKILMPYCKIRDSRPLRAEQEERHSTSSLGTATPYLCQSVGWSRIRQTR